MDCLELSFEVFIHIVHTLLILFRCERFFGGKIQNVSTDTGFVVSGTPLCPGGECTESVGPCRW